MTTDVINGVPRSLLHDLVTPNQQKQFNATHKLRALLAAAQPADHSEHDLSMVSQPAADGEREAFEAWLSSLKFVSGQGQAHVEYCLHRDLSDKYTTEWVSDMYRGWQARAAQPAKAEGVAGLDIERIRDLLVEAVGVVVDAAPMAQCRDPQSPVGKVFALLNQADKLLAAAPVPPGGGT